jgi:hypothetical protein
MDFNGAYFTLRDLVEELRRSTSALLGGLINLRNNGVFRRVLHRVWTNGCCGLIIPCGCADCSSPVQVESVSHVPSCLGLIGWDSSIGHHSITLI